MSGPDHPTLGPLGTPAPTRRRLVSTAEGTTNQPFTAADWALLSVPAFVWGSSFLLMAIGLDAFRPGLITWLRMIFGFAALATVPAARRTRIAPEDRMRIVLVGITWMAFPMSMFPIAEQWLSSSVTGMLNGSMPLFTAAIASVLLRRLPGTIQRTGLLVGFAGVVTMSIPSFQTGSRTALGALLVIAAMISYGIATNLVVPLQQTYGSVPVIWRSLFVAIFLTAPFGLVSLPGSHFEAGPFAAMLVLGAVGTGFAFIAATTLIGRVGATRGAILVYLTPVVALILGVVFRDEEVRVISVVGLVVVMVGAWLTSRAESSRPATMEP